MKRLILLLPALVWVTTTITLPAMASSHQVLIKDPGTDCLKPPNNYCYLPETLNTNVNLEVTWINQSTAVHNVKRCTTSVCAGVGPGSGGDSQFGSPPTISGNGGTFKFTFKSGGTYNYYCTIHSYQAMHGTVSVSGATTSPSPSPSPKTSPTASPTTSPSASPSPSQKTSASPGEPPKLPGEAESPAPSPSETVTAAGEQDRGGISGGLIVAAIAILAAGGAGAGLWWLRKTPASS